jgi:phospho-N-acetylmuramoyl-pentapeptide-transferase
MIQWLSKFFIDSIPPMRLFQYITIRAVYAAITALIISLLLGPMVIKALQRLKMGQSVRTDGPSDHLIKQGTPTMGGILMISSVVLSTLLWQNLHNFYTWLFLVAMLSFGIIGGVDDYLKIKMGNSDGISSKAKLLSQLFVATALITILRSYHIHQATLQNSEGLVHFSLFYLPFLKSAVLDLGLFYLPFAVIILVGASNATNLTDGLDGLLTGLLIFSFVAFLIIAYLSGRVDFASYLNIPYLVNVGELTVPIMAVIGGCMGFLWYNSHPAQIFMGDVGSLAFGGTLGLLAVILKKEVLLIMIGGVFVLETLSVIMQVIYFKHTKKKTGIGKRIFRMAPLHHHFEAVWKEELKDTNKPWNESKVVVRFWIIGVFFTLLALSTLKLR